MDEPIKIEFRVDGTDEGADSVDRLNTSLGRTGTTAQGATGNVSAMGSAMAVLGPVATGATVAIGAMTAGISAATVAMAAFLRELERQAGVINRFNGGIDEARRRTSGLVSELDLMTAQNRLVSRGITLNAHDFANLSVAVQETASAVGDDFQPTMDRMAEALSSMSSESLANFGIAVEQSQDKSATFTAVMADLESRFGDASSSADTVGGTLTQLSVAADDAGTAFLETINDSEALQQAFTEFFNLVTGGSEDFEGAMDRMVQAARVMGVAVNMILQELAAEFRAIGEVWDAFQAGNFREGIAALQRRQQEFRGFVEGFGDRLNAGAAAAGTRAAMRRGEQGGGPSRIRRVRPRGTGGEQGKTAADIARDENEAIIQAEQDAYRIRMENERAHTAMLRAEYQARADAHAEAMAEVDAEVERLMAKEDESREALRLKNERQLEEEKRAARERAEQIRSDAESILQPAVQGITQALAAVVANAQSADEAFQGLLSSFLTMIAERAAIEAAAQFAAAIGAFASYQYDKGALHLAAGAAWTGVAIAAGAGAIATAPSQAGPQAAQGPESQGAGGGNSYTYIVNGPVISAGNRAAAGREVSNLVHEGERRFGRRAA